MTALALNFTATIKPFEQNVGPLLEAAQAPFDIVGPSTDLQFDPTNDFVYTDTKRAYYVTATRYYEYGSQWRPVAPSNPANAPFEVRYYFHRFYHPYTKLFWHEIFNSGLAGLYTTTMQTQPDKVDPAAGDTFSFQTSYQPAVGRVNWGEDNEIIDFSARARLRRVQLGAVLSRAALHLAGAQAQSAIRRRSHLAGLHLQPGRVWSRNGAPAVLGDRALRRLDHWAGRPAAGCAASRRRESGRPQCGQPGAEVAEQPVQPIPGCRHAARRLHESGGDGLCANADRPGRRPLRHGQSREPEPGHAAPSARQRDPGRDAPGGASSASPRRLVHRPSASA